MRRTLGNQVLHSPQGLAFFSWVGLVAVAFFIFHVFGTASIHAQAESGKVGVKKDPSLPEGVRNAVAYIALEHDRFHKQGFIIYDDHGSGGCHLFPSLWMGDLVPPKPEPAWVAKVFNEKWANDPADGHHCLRVEYPKELAEKGQKMWVACGWQSPKVDGELLQYDLSRFLFPDEAVRLVFQVRGERGGERAEFKVFPEDPSDEVHVLTKQWKHISLPVTRDALRGPISQCFVWATNNTQNPRGSVFFLDNIRIEFGPKGTALRAQEPRFIRSYFTEPNDIPDKHFRNVCYVYDQALAVSALVATGDLPRARLVADAIVYAAAHDRFFKDHRLRNAYICGDLAGLGRTGPDGPSRLPGWWDAPQAKWVEDAYFAGSDCGNTAWAIIGLLNYWQAVGKAADSIYLKTAVRLGEWVDNTSFSAEGPGGFHGGLEGFEPIMKGGPGQTKSPWKSTEHAIDLFCAYTRLADATGNVRFRELAAHAAKFVKTMWNEEGGHLFTGTEKDGKTRNVNPIPLDVQAWSLLAFRDAKRFAPAIAWAAQNCRVPLAGPLVGYDFDTDRDGVWWEGTAQMCVAFRFLGQEVEADACVRVLREKGIVKAPNEARGGVYAASRDSLTTGFFKDQGDGKKAEPWVYYRRPHLGATCWYIFAELGWNPYWGARIR